MRRATALFAGLTAWGISGCARNLDVGTVLPPVVPVDGSTSSHQDVAIQHDGAIDIIANDGGPNVGPVSLIGQTSWSGYIEGFDGNPPPWFWGEGSPETNGLLRLKLSVSSEGVPQGALTFGEQLTVKVPMTKDDELIGAPTFLQGRSSGFLTGFDYTLRNATLTGDRLRFRVAASDPFDAWCALQIPNASTSACLPEGALSYSPCSVVPASGAPPIPVTCTQLRLCAAGGICRCDADVCFGDPNQSWIEFDLVHVGNKWMGSLGSTATIRLVEAL